MWLSPMEGDHERASFIFCKSVFGAHWTTVTWHKEMIHTFNARQFQQENKDEQEATPLTLSWFIILKYIFSKICIL